MSHGKLREDKNCLNCGHTVEELFCPHCGQENVETRQPFHYLFTHFIEDFTHYDGQFWKTIKYLLFRPGKLTKEYIGGKRKQYVAPVKLYIFISFITFFLPNILPSDHSDNEKIKSSKELSEKEQKKIIDSTYSIGIKKIEESNDLTKDTKEKIINQIEKEKQAGLEKEKRRNYFEINKDGASANLSIDDSVSKDGKIAGLFRKKAEEYEKKGLTARQINEKISEIFMHMLPKALFFYLPVFAFFLWLFHDKKKWWYFDHGIFTLHYFSFLLISTLLLIVFNSLNNAIDSNIVSIIYGLSFITICVYSMVYFFIAHHKIYESKKRLTLLKGICLLIINGICLFILLIGLVALSFWMIH